MKPLIMLSGFALASLIATSPVSGQPASPPLPALSPQQSAVVKQRMDLYREQTEDRVARGEITADEANRLTSWREWQIARQVAHGGAAPPAAMVYDSPPPDYHAPRPPEGYVVAPPPRYVPYYRYDEPYYWGPRPYYWGPSVCAGGFGRHFGGRICF